MTRDSDSTAQPSNSTKFILVAAVAALIATLGYSLLPGLLVSLATETEYAPGFREDAFVDVTLGQSTADVIQALGPPLSTDPASPTTEWMYAAPSHQGFAKDGSIRGTLTSFSFAPNGLLKSVWAQTEDSSSTGLLSSIFSGGVSVSLGKGFLGLSIKDRDALLGQSMDDIRARFGPPLHRNHEASTEYLIYSRSPDSSHYRLRRIGVDANGQVVSKESFVYWD